MPYDPSVVSEISWPYISGFVDGEGCISIKHQNGVSSFEITVAQVEDNDWVLHEIQIFLEENGIVCKLATHERLNENWRPCTYLTIRRVKDIYQFLIQCLPFLIVKRQRAIDVLRAIEIKSHTSNKPGVYAWLRGE